MDPNWQLFFYISAIVLFAVSGILAVIHRNVPLVLAAAGGVAVAFPLIWNTWQYV